MSRPQQRETEEVSTLFPKITAKTNMIYQAVKKRSLPVTSYVLPVIGTVKLHGTHADAVFPHPVTSDDFHLQSRNRTTLTLDSDNQGFAAFMLARRSRLLELKRCVLERYDELNPHGASSADHSLIIAGEFVGSGMRHILTGTAINTLTFQAFVVIGLNMGGQWQLDEDYGSVCEGGAYEEDRIYHISRGGFMKETLDIRRPDADIGNLLAHMESVAKTCPFAASLGIAGIGEGVVWKPYTVDAEGQVGKPRTYWPPEFWLKTKADEFWATQKSSVRPGYKLGATRDTAARFAQEAVSERRLQQGLEYLGEMGMDTTKKTSLGEFIKWLSKDVATEEALGTQELGDPDHWVSGEVRKIGIAWFLKNIKPPHVSDGAGT